MAAPRRVAQPGAGRIAVLVVLEGAFEDEDLFAAGVLVFLKHGAGRPADQRHHFRSEAMQRQDGEAFDQPREPLGATGIDDHAFAVAGMELAELDEQRTAFLAPGPVNPAGRVTDVAAGRVVAQFIGEGALQHQELLAKAVPVAIEAACREEPFDAGRARRLAIVAVQRPTLDAIGRRRNPFRPVGETDRSLVLIGVNPHSLFSLEIDRWFISPGSRFFFKRCCRPVAILCYPQYGSVRTRVPGVAPFRV